MNVWENIKTTFRRGDALVKLIYVNAGVFLALKVAVIVLKLFNLPGLPLYSWLAMPADPVALLHRPWTLLTYMFLHEGFFHLFFNMLCLYWFGKLFLTVYSERHLVGLYLVGGLVAGLTCAFKGKNAPAKLINKLSFQSYAKHFENGCWLAQDPAVTEAYNADPFNTQVFSAGFYKYFFRHGTRLYARERRAGLPKDTPVLLIAGREDPVGQYGKGVERLADFYRRNGLEVTCKLYDKGRHEILNERFRQQVFEDVRDFILGQCVRGSDAQTGSREGSGEKEA